MLRRWPAFARFLNDGRTHAATAGLDPPMRGRFHDDVGIFFGRDALDGRDIRIRFIGCEIGQMHARWEQAFSLDGETWEVNWIMHFDRQLDSATSS